MCRTRQGGRGGIEMRVVNEEVRSAASSGSAIAGAASSLGSCFSLISPALVLLLLAIAYGASWLPMGSGVEARGTVRAPAVCLGLAAACLPGAAAAPEGFTSSSAVSWFTDGMSTSTCVLTVVVVVLTVVVVTQGVAILALLAADRRRVLPKARPASQADPVSAPPSPPEPVDADRPSTLDNDEASGRAHQSSISLDDVTAEGSVLPRLRALDRNKDNQLDAAELFQLVQELRKEEAEKKEAEVRADRYKKAFLVAVLLLALLFGATFASSLAAAFLAKDTKVTTNNFLVSADNGEVLRTGSAEFALAPLVAPDVESDEAATEWHGDPNATTTVLVDANGGAVATAAATDSFGVLVDAGGAAVKTFATTNGDNHITTPNGQTVKTELAEYVFESPSDVMARMILAYTSRHLGALNQIYFTLPSDGQSFAFGIKGYMTRNLHVAAVIPNTPSTEGAKWVLVDDPQSDLAEYSMCARRASRPAQLSPPSLPPVRPSQVHQDGSPHHE